MITDKPDIVNDRDPRIQAPRICDMSKDDTPRERAMEHGMSVLSTADLWAVILRTGAVGNPITQLCRDIMTANDGSLRVLERRTRAELMSVRGVGALKALQIEAVMELIRRYNLEKPLENPQIKSSADIYAIMRATIGNLDHEEVWALYLNRGNKIVKRSCCSIGGLTSSLFDIKKIIKGALLENASGIILCHNHPSGQLRPSPQDDAITYKCRDAASLMDINMLDHLIVTCDGYYSYADQGRIK